MIQIDIEMPKDCDECPLCHRAFDGNETNLACYGLGEWCLGDEGRLDNCPLQEVSNNSPELDKENDELISRQAVLDAIFSEPLYESGMKKRDSDIIVPAIYEKIKALPPSPSRLKGHWIKHHESRAGIVYSCDRCGRTLQALSWETPKDVYKMYPFCHCGADMRGNRA